jgi:hypothetical protein
LIGDQISDLYLIGKLQSQHCTMSKLHTSEKVTKVTTSGGIGQHSYTQDETEAFADHINTVLQEDKHLKHLLPLKDPKDLFEATKDGVLLWYTLQHFS